MKQIVCLFGLLCAVALPFYAQNWTPQDSLRLQQLLKGDGEVKLNPDVLKELEINGLSGSPKAVINKSWLDFNTTMPMMPQIPEKKVVLTLRPYTANTKYNWDPVYQKKIVVKKDTWRGDPFYAMTTARWQKTEVRGIGGLDLMTPFTREFWDVKGRKRRARTLEVLRTYGDSISARIKPLP